jgi:hypothetical protein
LDEGTLKKHFPREIEVGAAELHARMGSFMVANIFDVVLWLFGRMNSGDDLPQH